MTRRQEEKIRTRLADKLAELTGNGSRRSELITERQNDPFDQMQSRLEVDLAVSAINTDWRTTRAVETALRLLETGEYGTCQECGGPINPKRLQAIPSTTLCIQCQHARDSDPDSEWKANFSRAA